MKTETVLVHVNSSVYIFPEVAIDVERVIQKSCSVPVGSKFLKNTCDSIQFLAKLHAEDLLLLQVILKDFARKYTEQLQILEKHFEEKFFCRTLRADFFYLSNHLRKF